MYINIWPPLLALGASPIGLMADWQPPLCDSRRLMAACSLTNWHWLPRSLPSAMPLGASPEAWQNYPASAHLDFLWPPPLELLQMPLEPSQVADPHRQIVLLSPRWLAPLPPAVLLHPVQRPEPAGTEPLPRLVLPGRQRAWYVQRLQDRAGHSPARKLLVVQAVVI